MEHILVQLGVFFALSAVVAVLFLYLKQSTVLAYIAVGILLGIFKSSIHLDHHIMEALSEIGIILLLFLAGMELDLSSLRKRLKLTLTNSLGQILTFIIIGTLVGVYIIGLTSWVSAVYFGLCLTFSSTIIVVKLLKDRKEIDSFHGQTLIGLLIMQDVTAIFALVFLKSMGGDQSLILTVGMIFLKMIVIGLVMFLFSRYVINYIFKKFAKTPELLFIGTLGYVLGIAAFCELIHFSPEIGAFLAGVTLATIPYKLEIEDKVEPIKNLGVILFFVTLGFNLDINAELINYIPAIAITAFIVFLGTPITMLVLGYIQKMKSRPSFFLGIMLNQISEFSLILATLSLRAGVFEKSTFMIITFASIISILLSSMGHSFLDGLYSFFKKRLVFIDKHSFRYEDAEELEGLELKNHIIFLEYNEIVDMMADKLAQQEKHVIILDCDPDKIDHIEKNESKFHHAIYADPLDPDIWEAIRFEEAQVIISGIEGNHEGEKAILEYLKKHASKAVTVIHSANYKEALEMYEQDVTYVILPEHLAGEHMAMLLEEHAYDFTKFTNNREKRIEALGFAAKEYMK